MNSRYILPIRNPITFELSDYCDKHKKSKYKDVNKIKKEVHLNFKILNQIDLSKFK